ncbi:MAG: pyridoxal phosphate-dependent aminotransferase, partial [Burkholderiales bacterium]|nr:pyridoxal phosphate-dependent aminotransferase [Burkholderiales bacterium]
MNKNMTTQTFATAARSVVRELRASKIREVANAGLGKANMLAFWFGEPDEPTAEDVCAVTIRHLQAGDTFYVQNYGLPGLRQRIADYVSAFHTPRTIDNIAVTSSGMSALSIVVQALVGHGDRVVAVTPLWPNLVEIPKVLGAQVTTVSLEFDRKGWQLDLDKLLAALTPDTRALMINSPNNPTGWTMTADEQRAVLAHCRQHGIWIITDEVYERYYFEGQCAPSFLDIADPQERVVSCNSFSKTWLMTGWRVGWIVAPANLIGDIGNLIEYNTSCAPAFVQHAADYAMANGEVTVKRTVDRLKNARDFLAAGLSDIPRIQSAPVATGAMYSFFKVDGVDDSLQFCKTLVNEAGL